MSINNNLFSTLSNYLDPNTDFEKLLKIWEDTNEYFLELVTIISFIPQVDKLLDEVLKKISFYFDIDIDEECNQFLSLMDKNYYGEITIKEAKDIILYVTAFNIEEHMATRIKNTHGTISYKIEQEKSKFYYLNLHLMCILYIFTMKKDKKKWKALGLFSQKQSLFFKQTPEQYLENLNNKLLLRVGYATQCRQKNFSIKECVEMVKSKYPFESVMEILWWKKYWAAEKPIMGMNYSNSPA